MAELEAALVGVPAMVTWLGGMGLAAPAAAVKATSEATKSFAYSMSTLLDSATGSGTHWSGLPNTSSAPGEVPASQSNDYAESWDFSPTVIVAGEVIGEAGTDASQAARLEWGFVGTDSLGRKYDQAPRPHIQQVLDVIAPVWVARIMEVAIL